MNENQQRELLGEVPLHSPALDEVAHNHDRVRATHLKRLIASRWTTDEIASAGRLSGWFFLEHFRPVVTIRCGL